MQLLHDTAEKASLKKQLEVARAVQQMLVPSEDVIERRPCGSPAHFQPAAECGGDWWTFHDLPDGRLLTVVGDVTGHGISSAIITGAAKAACDVVRTFAREQLSPAQLLRVMNCSIFEAGQQKFLMTCAACIFDPAAGSLTLANAGHPFPYLVRNNAIRQLAAQGEPLGAASSAEYHVEHHRPGGRRRPALVHRRRDRVRERVERAVHREAAAIALPERGRQRARGARGTRSSRRCPGSAATRLDDDDARRGPRAWAPRGRRAYERARPPYRAVPSRHGARRRPRL